MTTWIKSPYPGVRYRLHNKRKHGVKFDKYYSIRYRVDIFNADGTTSRKEKEEGIGWASEGWTAKKHQTLSLLSGRVGKKVAPEL